MARFYMSAEDLNSGPPAFSASSLSAELSPQAEIYTIDSEKLIGKGAVSEQYMKRMIHFSWGKMSVEFVLKNTEGTLGTEYLRGVGNIPHFMDSESSDVK